MKHLKYLSYVVRHKWWVMLACFRYAASTQTVSLIWQGLVHDWSKFLPSEWRPYASFFYGRGAELNAILQDGHRLSVSALNEFEGAKNAFDTAWLKHQHRSPHHWQHWVLREDSGRTQAIAMPRRYLYEMLADWEGAGRAITGKSGGTPAWYAKNRHLMQFHPITQGVVDARMGYEDDESCPF